MTFFGQFSDITKSLAGNKHEVKQTRNRWKILVFRRLPFNAMFTSKTVLMPAKDPLRQRPKLVQSGQGNWVVAIVLVWWYVARLITSSWGLVLCYFFVFLSYHMLWPGIVQKFANTPEVLLSGFICKMAACEVRNDYFSEQTWYGCFLIYKASTINTCVGYGHSCYSWRPELQYLMVQNS